jgi:hypothetical protein
MVRPRTHSPAEPSEAVTPTLYATVSDLLHLRWSYEVQNTTRKTKLRDGKFVNKAFYVKLYETYLNSTLLS